jgi:hypothetical protein
MKKIVGISMAILLVFTASGCAKEKTFLDCIEGDCEFSESQEILKEFMEEEALKNNIALEIDGYEYVLSFSMLYEPIDVSITYTSNAFDYRDAVDDVEQLYAVHSMIEQAMQGIDTTRDIVIRSTIDTFDEYASYFYRFKNDSLTDKKEMSLSIVSSEDHEDFTSKYYPSSASFAAYFEQAYDLDISYRNESGFFQADVSVETNELSAKFVIPTFYEEYSAEWENAFIESWTVGLDESVVVSIVE